MLPPEQERALCDAVQALRAGRQIGLPTETVYGLAADATNVEAVAGIFRIKGRPQKHPLILHLGETSWLSRYCLRVPPLAYRLSEAFWPGPLTMVLHRSESVPNVVTGGLSTVAVRVPAHPVALRLLRELGRPLAAPSANRFGAVSPTTRQHVLDDLGDDVALVLEGGPCEVGVESTIVDLTREKPRVLRPGGVSKEALEQVIGSSLSEDDGRGPAAPGGLAVHYSPKARVVIVTGDDLWSEARRYFDEGLKVGVMNFGEERPGSDIAIAVAELQGDPRIAAQRLFSALRQLDAAGCEWILTSLPKSGGIGAALVDRILRAAASGESA